MLNHHHLIALPDVARNSDDGINAQIAVAETVA
jgi:hypothetical protein